MSAELQNRFIKRPLHGHTKVTDDEILVAYRRLEMIDEEIRIKRESKERVYTDMGLTRQAFGVRIKKLKEGGFIED